MKLERYAKNVLLAIFLATAGAAAHHPSTSVTPAGSNLTSTLSAGSARARQRVQALAEVVRASDESSGTPSTIHRFTLGGAVLVLPGWSLGARFPWVFVQQGERATNGYGDTLVELMFTPDHDPASPDVLTLGLLGSLPTKSYQLSPDPGDIYSASPFAVFTRRLGHVFWQALLLSGVESRPAGIAWEASAGFSAGYVLDLGLGARFGGRVDTRLASYCRSASGEYGYCNAGRVTEQHRRTGSTRAYAIGELFNDFGSFGITAGAQIPVTPRRDFDLSALLALECRF